MGVEKVKDYARLYSPKQNQNPKYLKGTKYKDKTSTKKDKARLDASKSQEKEHKP